MVKKYLIKLPAILMVAVFLGVLVIPAFLTVLSPIASIPSYVLEFAKENDLGPLTRISEYLYQTDDGRFIGVFEALPVSAGTFEYHGTDKDGYLTASNADYSVAHDAATGTVTAGTTAIRVGQQYYDGTTYYIYRGGVFFDTSAIPDDAIISDAALAIEPGGDYSQVDFYTCVVSGEDLVSTGLVTSDYGDLGTTDAILGAADSSDMTVGEHVVIGLTEGGISDISLNSTTAFGLRSYWDIIEYAAAGDTILTLVPDGNAAQAHCGYGSDWPYAGAASRYQCVDELVMNEFTDYLVDASTSRKCSFFDVTDHTPVANSSNPQYVKIGAWYSYQYTDVNMTIYVYTHGTRYGSQCVDCGGGGWRYYSYTWWTNPNTGAQWTWDEVNAMEIGTGLTASGNNYVTQLYAQVRYTPGGVGTEYIDFASYEQGASDRPYLLIEYTVGNIPTAPTELLCNDEEAPTTDDMTPYFSAVGHHEDAGATLNWYSMEVDDDIDFSSPMYTSGQTAFATNITDGERCEDIDYSGSPLQMNTRYYWHIKFYDDDEDESPWSSTSFFDFGTPTNCPTNFVANPVSASQITLTWDAGTAMQDTGVWYKLNSYPASREDGEKIYQGPSESFYHQGLLSGTNYYYRAWGYNPTYNWSDCYAEDWATTLAGADDEGPDTPGVPPEWDQDPSCYAYSKLPLYDIIIGASNSLGLPEGTACLLLTMGFIVLVGIVGYGVSGRSEMVLLLVIAVGILVASVVGGDDNQPGLLPLWFIAIALALGGVVMYIWKRA